MLAGPCIGASKSYKRRTSAKASVKAEESLGTGIATFGRSRDAQCLMQISFGADVKLMSKA